MLRFKRTVRLGKVDSFVAVMLQIQLSKENTMKQSRRENKSVQLFTRRNRYECYK